MVEANRRELAMASDEYLTTAEVAHLCRTSPDTVRFWRHVGRGPKSFKVGRRVLYQRGDVERWLEGLRDGEALR
jgi:excisionase family DNA binding protein